MTTILIADDHEVVRSGLRGLLSERPGWEVVAEAADGKEAVAQAVRSANEGRPVGPAGGTVFEDALDPHR